MQPTSAIPRSVDIAYSYPTAGAYPADGARADGPASRGKGRSFMWLGLSGSLLSALGFVALSLFEQYNHSVNELQRDLKHFNEQSGEFVKKESLKRHLEHLKDCTKELQAAAVARNAGNFCLTPLCVSCGPAQTFARRTARG